MAENAEFILGRAERESRAHSAARAVLAGFGLGWTDTRTSMCGVAIADSISILERAK
jgi:hypothetical protein